MASGGSALRNFAAYGGLIVLMTGAQFAILATYPSSSQADTQFTWVGLAFVAVLGLIGTAFTSIGALPGLWPAERSLWARLVKPLGLGGAIGVAAAISDGATGWGAELAKALNRPGLHLAWPMSAPIYTQGAIVLTILYFLVVIPPVTWLASTWLMRGKGLDVVYWILALPLAGLDAWLHGDLSVVQSVGAPAAVNTAVDLAVGLAQAWTLRRSGLVAAVLVRLGFYAVWHIAWGNWLLHALIKG